MNLEIQNDNLLELQALYFSKDEFQLGRIVALELSEVNLDIDDTDYFETKISLSKEPRYYSRFECLNNLLDFYSILELGFLTNFIPSAGNYDYQKLITSLDEGNIKNYCFKYFRSMLPLQLLDRMNWKFENQDSNVLLIYQFLGVLDYIADNKAISTLFSAKSKTLNRLFNNLLKVDQLKYDNLKKKDRQLVAGYFAYLELLPMIAELVQGSSGYEYLKIALTNFFVKYIDDSDEKVKYILEGTNHLYEKFYNRETSQTDVESFVDLKKTISILKGSLSESSSLILV